MPRHVLQLACLTVLCLAFGCSSQAGPPQVDIGERHGNLRAAQEHIVQAWRLIGEAQYDNNSKLGGHAGRARQLLAEADAELRAAADVANEHEL
ncbi:hypothetical protein HNP46_003623 [Pseudomonas nitritireducens]|uniref:DUF4398 domain-containing protein n=1 Tax=Pseudomonas nitroreducens TaxID=46680 RepID=A0A7W7KLJ7_PSENT|nr:hypothetical protein [Pseudomonas nitritireducens]MBB4864751.1 hypothetical protein [Pseudomonas nitritireducens]